MPSNRITINATATTTTFVVVNVDIRKPGLMTEEVTRPGVDGKAFRKVSTRGGTLIVNGWVDASDAAARDGLVTTITSFVGKIVTIDDSFGVTHTNILVRDVRELRRAPVAAVVGGLSTNPAFQVNFELICEDLKTA